MLHVWKVYQPGMMGHCCWRTVCRRSSQPRTCHPRCCCCYYCCCCCTWSICCHWGHWSCCCYYYYCCCCWRTFWEEILLSCSLAETSWMYELLLVVMMIMMKSPREFFCVAARASGVIVIDRLTGWDHRDRSCVGHTEATISMCSTFRKTMLRNESLRYGGHFAVEGQS